MSTIFPQVICPEDYPYHKAISAATNLLRITDIFKKIVVEKISHAEYSRRSLTPYPTPLVPGPLHVRPLEHGGNSNNGKINDILHGSTVRLVSSASSVASVASSTFTTSAISTAISISAASVISAALRQP
jgi:hypothetical protein